jgi:hypothetical protein
VPVSVMGFSREKYAYVWTGGGGGGFCGVILFV